MRLLVNKITKAVYAEKEIRPIGQISLVLSVAADAAVTPAAWLQVLAVSY